MAEQTVVEKMSELQVGEGKKVILHFHYLLKLSHISLLAYPVVRLALLTAMWC